MFCDLEVEILGELGCSITAGQSSCMDFVHSVSFADGDLLAVRYNELGLNLSSRLKYTILHHQEL